MRRRAVRERRVGRISSRWDVRLKIAIVLAGVVAFACIALIPTQHGPIDFSRWVGDAIGLTQTAENGKPYRDTRWYELGPAGWDPYKEVRELQRSGGSLSDSDPRAVELSKKTRDIWDKAPTNPAMDGAAVRIPGYVVPLDQTEKGTGEFLLVPYFGACIHTPVPPSNQIILVKLATRKRGMRTMDNVWVSGTLKALRSDSPMGMSSYSMDAKDIRPYVPPPQ